MRRGLIAAVLAAVANVAPAVATDDACPGAEQGFQRIKGEKDARYEIAFRWEPAEPKVGEFFAAEVVECISGAWEVAGIAVGATMPAHGHGMNYRPTVERIAPRRYRVTGLMLHMPGTWRFTFVVLFSGKSDVIATLTHDVDLQR
jgi:hypothetical protein